MSFIAKHKIEEFSIFCHKRLLSDDAPISISVSVEVEGVRSAIKGEIEEGRDFSDIGELKIKHALSLICRNEANTYKKLVATIADAGLPQ